MDQCYKITYIFTRHLGRRINYLLPHTPAIVLLGPRHRAKLANPARYLAGHENELVILNEVHRAPELFQQLRGIIDKALRAGKGNGRFLLIGSAAMDLLQYAMAPKLHPHLP